MEPTPLVQIAAGLVLLVFGRRLFWLLVGAAGFMVGFYLSHQLVGAEEGTGAFITGLVFGIGGALLAVFAQKAAILIGGFLAGGYAVMMLLSGTGLAPGLPAWIPFLAGGIAGAFLLSILFDWTLIVLTSLLGGIMILQAVAGGAALSLPLAVLFAAVGVVIQGKSRKKQ